MYSRTRINNPKSAMAKKEKCHYEFGTIYLGQSTASYSFS